MIEAEKGIWEGDLLGRKEEGKYLRRYIENLYDLDKKDQTSFVLNINSEWGYGKTWFLKNLAKELNQNHPVVYFDAWKNDFSKDALLSFVSVICEELSKLYWKKGSVVRKVSKVKSTFSLMSKNALPVLVAILAKQLTGKALEDIELSDDVKGTFADASEQLSKVVSTSIIDGFITQKNAIDDFSNAIQSLVNEIEKDSELHLPICIIIDELDRCRPTYAIELLETVKHLFSVRGIFFIIATDTSQLAHSVKAVYGQEFNAIGYLKRFFYSEYSLAIPEYNRVANSLFEETNIQDKFLLPGSFYNLGVKGMFALIAEFFRLNIRDQKQVFFVLETIVLTSSVNQFHFIFLAFLICFKHKFNDAYKQFSPPNSHQKFKDFILEKVSSAELKNLSFLGRYWDNRVATSQEYTLGMLFEAYMDYMVNVQYQYDNSTGFDWMNEARQQIADSSINGSINYFELINQSGKIKS